MADRAPTGAELTTLLRRAEQHARNVEPLLERLVAAVLDKAADVAATAFQRHATNYMTAAANGGVTAQSTMICVKPTPDQAAALAIPDGTPPENMHCTLVYLGETTGPLSGLVDVLRPVAARHAALSGVVGGVGSFTDTGDGFPIIALPDVPGLVELRVAVTDALVRADVPYARDHGYCPHMTLGYMAAPEFVTAAAGQPVTYGELLLVRGDTEIVPLPLSGRPPLTASGDPDRSSVPIPGAPGWHGDMRGVDRLLDLLKAEDAAASLFDRIAAVADKHAPGGGYGETYWHYSDHKVWWVCGDWTTEEERDKAEADFMAIPEVDAFEAGWEEYPTSWAQVYARPSSRVHGLRSSLAADAGDPPPWGYPAPDEVVDVQRLVAAITARTKPVRDAAVEAAAAPVLGAVGISYDVTNPLVAEVLAQTGSQIVEIADTTQLNVMRIVRASYDAGLSIPDTATAIREGMHDATPARARLIARTELAGAVNGGSLAAVRTVEQATGTTYRKSWMTAPGAKHPRHYLYDGLNGQTRKLHEKFDVGGSELDHPGDPEGAAREVCNCRCAMRYQTGEGDE